MMFDLGEVVEVVPGNRTLVMVNDCCLPLVAQESLTGVDWEMLGMATSPQILPGVEVEVLQQGQGEGEAEVMGQMIRVKVIEQMEGAGLGMLGKVTSLQILMGMAQVGGLKEVLEVVEGVVGQMIRVQVIEQVEEAGLGMQGRLFHLQISVELVWWQAKRASMREQGVVVEVVAAVEKILQL